ncbi:peptidoglycan recognition protein family protein, partial [Bacillus thuringiensis]
MNPEFITVHNTYNDAPAENEIAYMIRNNNQVSFHIAVDDKEAVQGLPLERNAWACGDGNGSGNRKSISVEICYSLSGGDRYYKAENNAAIIVAQLMKQ